MGIFKKVFPCLLKSFTELFEKLCSGTSRLLLQWYSHSLKELMTFLQTISTLFLEVLQGAFAFRWRYQIKSPQRNLLLISVAAPLPAHIAYLIFPSSIHFFIRSTNNYQITGMDKTAWQHWEPRQERENNGPEISFSSDWERKTKNK